MPRGGMRSGKPGATYGNRQDLQQGSRPLPVSTAHNQQYGAATAQAASQQALPMAGTPLPPAPSEPAAQQTVSPAAPPMTPSDVPNLMDPTGRPDEHVMSGAPVGPGDGAMPTPVLAYQSAKDQISSIAQAQPTNTAVQYLLAQLGQGF